MAIPIHHVERARLLDERFPFGIAAAEYNNFSVRMHDHPFTELFFILGGVGLQQTPHGDHVLRAGDVFVLCGTRAHAIAQTQHLRIVNIYCDLTKLGIVTPALRALPGYRQLFSRRAPRNPEGYLHLEAGDRACVEELLARLSQEHVAGRCADHAIMITALLTELLVTLCRCATAAHVPNTQALRRLSEVIGFMDTHYDEPHHLPDLARRAQMSVNNFLLVFRRATGHSPIEYVIRQRVTTGALLLRTTADGITDIALRVGFSDSEYFARQFKRIMGMPPRAYRQRAAGRP